MSEKDGGPAFPQPIDRQVGMCPEKEGMTLRDYFAAKALAGILPALVQGIRPQDIPKMAADCYGIADALLAERAK